MKSLFVLFLVLVGTQGYANQTGKVRYDEIQRMFEQGTTLTPDSTIGYHAGRCFQMLTDDNQKPWYSDALQAILKVEPYLGDDAGPAFPNKKRNIAQWVVAEIYKGGWEFDNFTIANVNERLIFPSVYISPTEFDGRTLSWKMDYKNGEEVAEVAARSYNNYIVITSNYIRFDNKPTAPNELKYVCYFYKKLQ